MSVWQSVMLPVSTMSVPGCSLSAATSATGSPDRIVEFCHSGSVSVEDTTYLSTWFR